MLAQCSQAVNNREIIGVTSDAVMAALIVVVIHRVIPFPANSLLDSYYVNGIRQFPPNSARKKAEISYIHLINQKNLVNNSRIRLGKKRKETAGCFCQKLQ